MRVSKNSFIYYLTVFCILLYYIVSLDFIMSFDNVIYGVEQLNFYNSNLYNGNFALSDETSPRFIMNFIFSVLLKITNQNYACSTLIIVFTSLVILSIAITKISFNISKKHYFLLTIILSIFIRKNLNVGIASFTYWAFSTLGLGLGISFVFLAISEVIGKKKRWNRAFFFLIFALFSHIHEGIWGFVIICILYICKYLIDKKKFTVNKENYLILIFIIVLIFSVLPGIFSKASLISSKEFIGIYAFFRTPHHLVPSTWKKIVIFYQGILLILSSLTYSITILCFEKSKNKKCIALFKFEVCFLLFSWVIALTCTYLFTEIYPIVSIVLLYIPKYFKYVSFIFLLYLIKSLAILLNDNKYITYIITLCSIVCINYYKYCFIIYILFFIGLYLDKKITFATPGVILNKLNDFFIKKNLLYICTFLCAILFFSFSQKFFTLSKTKKFAINAYMINAMGSDLFELSKKFENSTSLNESFISDPYFNETGWFQLASHRNTFVTFKNIPAYKSLISSWYKKVIESKNLFDKSTEEIIKIMEKNKIKYILVKKINYKKFDEVAKSFELFNTCSSDQFRIYKLKNEMGN